MADRADGKIEAGEVVQLELAGQGIRRVQGLDQLTALRHACLADNELTGLQGLPACTALHHLSLQVSPALLHPMFLFIPALLHPCSSLFLLLFITSLILCPARKPRGMSDPIHKQLAATAFMLQRHVTIWTSRSAG